MKSFLKDFRKLDNKIKIFFTEKQRIFLEDEFSSILKNHKLKGKFKGHRSINISGDFRLVYIYNNEREIYYFVRIGTHSQLYS